MQNIFTRTFLHTTYYCGEVYVHTNTPCSTAFVMYRSRVDWWEFYKFKKCWCFVLFSAYSSYKLCDIFERITDEEIGNVDLLTCSNYFSKYLVSLVYPPFYINQLLMLINKSNFSLWVALKIVYSSGSGSCLTLKFCK